MRLSSPVHRSSVAIALCALASAVVPARSAAAQESQDKPFAVYSASAESLRDSIVAMARAQIGTRYRTGGESPKKGFDCSGLVQYVMSALNLSVPRTARLQAKTGLAISRDTSQLLPGDLLTFGKGKKGKISHVAIYVGDGRYVHASSVAGRVIESSIDRPYSPLIKIWRGARRILTLDDSASAAATSGPSKGGH